MGATTINVCNLGVHRIGDWHASDNENILDKSTLDAVFGAANNRLGSHKKAPIIHFGYNVFNFRNFEGNYNHTHSLGPTYVMTQNHGKPIDIPRPIVGIGAMDMNWGWMSTNFLNRTINWGATLNHHKARNPYKKDFTYPQEQLQIFLDNPNLIMFITNQHHNMTHPKVLSMPLGINNKKNTWLMLKRVEMRSIRKTQIMFSAFSNYGSRPATLQCVQEKMEPSSIHVNPFTADKVHGDIDLAQLHYLLQMAHCRAVLCLAGMGSDTFRIWESLIMGSMPVVERGMGLDRTFYKLPVLILDDFYDISTFIVKQAYVEALYRVDEWEYERLTDRYWQKLISEVSFSGKIDYMLERHPMEAMDEGFTRPLVPFSCERGCGPNTKRTPRKSCGIDDTILNEQYYSKYLP